MRSLFFLVVCCLSFGCSNNNPNSLLDLIKTGSDQQVLDYLQSSDFKPKDIVPYYAYKNLEIDPLLLSLKIGRRFEVVKALFNARMALDLEYLVFPLEIKYALENSTIDYEIAANLVDTWLNAKVSYFKNLAPLIIKFGALRQGLVAKRLLALSENKPLAFPLVLALYRVQHSLPIVDRMELTKIEKLPGFQEIALDWEEFLHSKDMKTIANTLDEYSLLTYPLRKNIPMLVVYFKARLESKQYHQKLLETAAVIDFFDIESVLKAGARNIHYDQQLWSNYVNNNFPAILDFIDQKYSVKSCLTPIIEYCFKTDLKLFETLIFEKYLNQSAVLAIDGDLSNLWRSDLLLNRLCAVQSNGTVRSDYFPRLFAMLRSLGAKGYVDVLIEFEQLLADNDYQKLTVFAEKYPQVKNSESYHMVLHTQDWPKLPLWSALQDANIPLCKYLLDNNFSSILTDNLFYDVSSASNFYSTSDILLASIKVDDLAKVILLEKLSYTKPMLESISSLVPFSIEIYTAIQHNSINCFKHYLKAMADINSVLEIAILNPYQKITLQGTPLTISNYFKQKDMVDLCIAASAKVNLALILQENGWYSTNYSVKCNDFVANWYPEAITLSTILDNPSMYKGIIGMWGTRRVNLDLQEFQILQGNVQSRANIQGFLIEETITEEIGDSQQTIQEITLINDDWQVIKLKKTKPL